MANPVVTLEYKGRVAVITIRNEAKLNALTQHDYYEISKNLREIATHDEVFVTVLLAKGRFFSAYAYPALTLVHPQLPRHPHSSSLTRSIPGARMFPSPKPPRKVNPTCASSGCGPLSPST